MKKHITLIILLLVLICSCGKQEPSAVTQERTYEYDQDSEQYSDKISDTVMLDKNANVKLVELPENILVRKEDVSIRTYTKPNAPINKRFTYRILVSDKIKREQIEPLFTKLTKDIISEDNDIDDITIWLYSEKDLINGTYDVAMATWAPADGEVTKEIAVSNNRDSYKLVTTIRDNLEEYLSRSKTSVVGGLSYDLRKKIYQELANTETKAREKLDKIYPYTANFDTDNYANKLDELTKKYEKEISKKYKIDDSTVKNIYEEGDKNEWYNL